MSDNNTVFSVLSNINTGVGFDVSKNHTGVVIWDNATQTLKEYGFALHDYNINDNNSHAEIEMRTEFKQKLAAIVNGKSFDFGVIEDVYGGKNYDTVRKLLALNTVIDELIQEGVCSIKDFHRVKEPTWRSGLRIVYTPSMTGMKAKMEVQEALYHLDYPFMCIHKDDSPKIKKEIFFEDICDACGMLTGIVAKTYIAKESDNKQKIKPSKLKIKYVNSEEELQKITKKTNKPVEQCELNLRKIEQSIVDILSEKDICGYMQVSSNKLGSFGLKRKLTYFDVDTPSYLIFWK